MQFVINCNSEKLFMQFEINWNLRLIAILDKLQFRKIVHAIWRGIAILDKLQFRKIVHAIWRGIAIIDQLQWIKIVSAVMQVLHFYVN